MADRIVSMRKLLYDKKSLALDRASIVDLPRSSICKAVRVHTLSVCAVFFFSSRLDELVKIGCPGDWTHITSQIGMFSFTGLTPPQVSALACDAFDCAAASIKLQQPWTLKALMDRDADDWR